MKYSTAALKEKFVPGLPNRRAKRASPVSFCRFAGVGRSFDDCCIRGLRLRYWAVGVVAGRAAAGFAAVLFLSFFRTMLQGVADKQIRHRERARQAEEYNNLPFRRTFRGMAFYLTGFILLVTMLMGLLTQSYDIFLNWRLCCR